MYWKNNNTFIKMENFTVKVPGVDFELSSNQIYHIREVTDNDAPDGYQQAGITKHPLPGIAQGISVPYSNATKTWNTGFSEANVCYSKEHPREAKKILGTVTKYLLPKLELLVEGDLTNNKSSNNTFFDEFTPFNGEGVGDAPIKYKIKGGNMFNTKNPLEFLALWWALIGKQIMPPGKENEGTYKNCAYVLEDKKQSTNVSQDKELEKQIATSTVLGIVKNKKNKEELAHLQNLFTYVGLNLEVETTELAPLISTFTKWCEKAGYNNENAIEFNEAVDKFQDKKDRDELFVYVDLIKKIKDSKVKVERKDILIEGQNLGSDKKIAARKIAADQELYKTFLLL